MAEPILVTGSHRSGTTWVGRMLAAAPGVQYVHEPFSPRCRPGVCGAAFDRWFTHVHSGNEDRYRPWLERTLRFRYSAGRELRALRSPRDAGRAFRDAARFAAARAAGRRPLWKDPIALFSAEWLAERLGMRVVVLVRHPAAFASSLLRLDWTFPFRDLAEQETLMDTLLAPYRAEVLAAAGREPDLLDQAALLWRLFHHVIDEYRTRHPGWIVLRHEDLSRAPLEGFLSLYRELGLEPTDEAVAVIRAHSRGGNPVEAGDAALDVRRDSRANIDSWRRRLDADRTDRIRAAVSDVAPLFYGEDEW